MAEAFRVEPRKKIAMKPVTKKRAAGLMLLALIAGGNVFAQERIAYKHVDAAGKITYSQTPPVNGKDAKTVDIAPAQRGRGGNTDGYAVNDDSRYYANPQTYNPYAASMQARQRAQEQRYATLKAECLRQRGTDCNNPAALRYEDSTSIPRRGRY